MQEDAEDAQHRAQYGTNRWTRPPSNAANAELMSRAETLGGMLEAAGASDALVRAKFGEAEPRLILLGSDEVCFPSLPPSRHFFFSRLAENTDNKRKWESRKPSKPPSPPSPPPP